MFEIDYLKKELKVKQRGGKTLAGFADFLPGHVGRGGHHFLGSGRDVFLHHAGRVAADR